MDSPARLCSTVLEHAKINKTGERIRPPSTLKLQGALVVGLTGRNSCQEPGALRTERLSRIRSAQHCAQCSKLKLEGVLPQFDDFRDERELRRQNLRERWVCNSDVACEMVAHVAARRPTHKPCHLSPPSKPPHASSGNLQPLGGSRQDRHYSTHLRARSQRQRRPNNGMRWQVLSRFEARTLKLPCPPPTGQNYYTRDISSNRIPCLYFERVRCLETVPGTTCALSVRSVSSC